MTHVLKIWPVYYSEIIAGRKRFEIRFEDGRKFAVGDTLLLREWDREREPEQFTGRQCDVEVLSILRGPNSWMPAGMVVMSITTPGPEKTFALLESEKPVCWNCLGKTLTKLELCPTCRASGEIRHVRAVS
jgi:hypothetical protein